MGQYTEDLPFHIKEVDLVKMVYGCGILFGDHDASCPRSIPFLPRHLPQVSEDSRSVPTEPELKTVRPRG